MASLGTAYVDIAPSTKGLGKSINNAFQGQGENAGQGLGKTAGNGFIASGFSKVVAGAFAATIAGGVALVVGNMDAAIKRYDTLNNFPKVLQNLGASSEDAAAATEGLKTGLDGLPTTLDSAAGGVQQLYAATGDIGKSTDLFLSLNNALLGTGKTSEQTDRGMYHLQKAFSANKMEGTAFNELMEIMPAQLKQVAKFMGYDAATGANSLQEAMKNGEVSMDDFGDAMMTLNAEGGAGMSSFQTQAEDATGGIGTSIATMKSAVVRGVTDMVANMDSGLSSFGGVSGIMSTIGGSIEGVFKKIGSAIPSVISGIQTMMPLIKALAVVFGVVTAGIMAYNTAIFLKATYEKLAAVATTIMSGVTKAAAAAQWLLNAAMNANPIGLIVLAIVGLVAAFAILWNKSESFRNFWKGLWNGIKSVASTVVNALKTFFTKTIPNAFKSFGTAIKTGLKVALLVFTAFPRLVISVLLTLIPKIISFAKKIPSAIKTGVGNLADIAKNLIAGLWNGFKNAITNVFDRVKGLFKLLPKAIKKLLGIHSPSKIFAWIGQMLGVGFGIGAIDSLQVAKKDIDSQINGMLGDYSQTAQVTTNFGTPANQAQTMASDILSGLSTLLSAKGKEFGEIIINLDGKTIARNTFSYSGAIGKQMGVPVIG